MRKANPFTDRLWRVLWWIDDGIHRHRLLPWSVHRPFCNAVDTAVWMALED